MKKLTTINGKPNSNNVKSVLHKAKNTAKKVLQVGVLGTALTAATTLTTGCTPGTFYNGELIEEPHKTQGELYEPYDIAMGNGNYFFHNFMGEEPDIIEQTVTTDVERYLSAGQAYLQNLFADFNNTLIQRPTLQRYFRRFNYRVPNGNDHSNHHPDYNQKHGGDIDTTINQISAACEPIMADIVKNLNSETDRDAIIICYRVLGNEAYKEGLGEYRDNEDDNVLMDKYQQEVAELKTACADNYNLSFNLENEINILHCRRITDNLDTLLNRAVLNMNHSLNDELTIADLRKVINIALTTRSLEAMHDYTQDNLKHLNCNMELGITAMMQAASAEKQAEYQTSRGL